MSNTVYPGALDTFTNPQATDTLASVSHILQHGLDNDATLALETKLGYDSSNQTITGSGLFLVSTGAGKSQWLSSLTSPKITTSLFDTNGATWVGQTATASAVNYLNVTNAATGNAPSIGGAGSDTNVDLNITSQGSGKVRENGSSILDFRTSFNNYVQSGCVWTAGVGLAASMTAGTLWINGVEYTVGAITNHSFTASDDTYVDYTAGTGITYSAVSNNSASHALAANSIRLGIIVAGAASISSINQGSPTVTAPVASSVVYSVCDSLGNLIYPTSPNPKSLGYRQILTTFPVTSATPTYATGLSVPIIPPASVTRVKVSGYTVQLSSNAATVPTMYLYSGASSGTLTTALQQFNGISSSTLYCGATIEAVVPITAGTTTYFSVAAANSNGADTTSVTANTNIPAFINVEAA